MDRNTRGLNERAQAGRRFFMLVNICILLVLIWLLKLEEEENDDSDDDDDEDEDDDDDKCSAEFGSDSDEIATGTRCKRQRTWRHQPPSIGFK